MATEARPNLAESSWDRARQDTTAATQTLRFWFFDAVCGIVVGTAVLLILLRWGPGNVWVLAGVPPAAGIAWLVAGVLLIFSWQVFWAPYRQRDEARTALAKQSAHIEEDQIIRRLRREVYIIPVGSEEGHKPDDVVADLSEVLSTLAELLSTYQLDLTARAAAAVLLRRLGKGQREVLNDVPRKTIGGVFGELRLYGLIETRGSGRRFEGRGFDEKEHRLTERGKRVALRLRDYGTETASA